MIIVKFTDGMGNQMFQYAFYLALRYANPFNDIKVDLHELDCNFDSPIIFNIFKLQYNVASTSDYNRLGCFNFWDRFKRRLGIRKKTVYVERDEGVFDNRLVCNINNRYYQGYWQSYKYFESFRNDLLRYYKFPIPDNSNNHFIKLINKYQNSVSLHVRMGDYLRDDCVKIFGNICTKDYYLNAVNYFRNRFGDCHFFLFSNDLNKAIDFLNMRDAKDVTVVDCNDEKNGWADMYLMSLCRFNIIANSSFSWWGAWLNQNESKVVIAPKKWLNTQEMPDICPPDWIRI